MKTRSSYRLRLGKALRPLRAPMVPHGVVARAAAAKPILSPATVVRALKATRGADHLIAKIPNLVRANVWAPIATFSACLKTGTAAYLDIWDADHFDGFTDMSRCLSECRVWFSADGFTYWDSPQTKTGRINCYFRASSAGTYVCNAQLQSYNGPAQVQCLIDSYNFGPLPFNGAINQPHPASLSAGYHSFRIRQLAGSFFFIGLTVWRV